jgi:hypothetical protein
VIVSIPYEKARRPGVTLDPGRRAPPGGDMTVYGTPNSTQELLHMIVSESSDLKERFALLNQYRKTMVVSEQAVDEVQRILWADYQSSTCIHGRHSAKEKR